MSTYKTIRHVLDYPNTGAVLSSLSPVLQHLALAIATVGIICIIEAYLEDLDALQPSLDAQHVLLTNYLDFGASSTMDSVTPSQQSTADDSDSSSTALIEIYKEELSKFFRVKRKNTATPQDYFKQDKVNIVFL